VTWGRGNQREIGSVAELDHALDEVAADGSPRVVGIYPPEHLIPGSSPWDGPQPPALQIGLGHPDRSFVLWLGPDTAVGSQPEAPSWPDGAAPIAFDYAGDPIFCGPDRARVTPQAARTAARLFISTGQRPTNLHWTTDDENLFPRQALAGGDVPGYPTAAGEPDPCGWSTVDPAPSDNRGPPRLDPGALREPEKRIPP